MTREEQKEQRQRQIMMKALELFVTKGYSETKISDIAGALGISMGLMFHYYESKEHLYKELVKTGAAYSSRPEAIKFTNAAEYFDKTLTGLFAAIKAEPMIYHMFVLMSQARRQGIPGEIREIALSVDQMKFSANVIEQGQREGCIREGDPMALSFTFWCAVQGIMEQHMITPEIPLPDKQWLLDIILKK